MPARYSSVSPEELVQACIATDNNAAWTEFVRRFRPLIARVVLRIARRRTNPHPHVIDDLIQETFLKLCADQSLLLRRFQSRHQDSIFGFLKVVAASVVQDHLKFERARKRDVTQTDAMSEDSRGEYRPSARGTLDSMERQVLMHQLDEAIKTLFPRDHLPRNRVIFWLHHVVGMTASEIASIPSIGLNTKGVESVLRRMTHVIQSHVGTRT